MKTPVRLDYSEFSGKNMFVRERHEDVSYPHHWHNYYEMILYRKCRGECVLNGKAYPLEKNCIFLLTPVDFHSISAEKDEKSSSINVSFKPEIISRHVPILKPLVLYEPSEFIISLFEKMLGAYKSKNSDYLCSLLNTALFALAENVHSDHENKSINACVKEIITFLLENPNTDISVAELANMHGLSPAYLSDLFRRETGMTLRKYCNRLKIEYACNLLSSGKISVLEAAYESGFNSASQFFRVFKSVMNDTPLHWLKQ